MKRETKKAENRETRIGRKMGERSALGSGARRGWGKRRTSNVQRGKDEG
jgi:hypothetical protein